jgi:hypothetical protein
MILEPAVQAKFLIPMAISLGFGVLFATAITLFIDPSLHLMLLRRGGKKAVDLATGNG